MRLKSCILVLSALLSINGFAQESTPQPSQEEVPIKNSVGSGDDAIYNKVEVEAEFPGGEKAYILFLQKNLNAYIAEKNKAPMGRYTVVIEFIIEIDGSLTYPSATEDPGYGTAEEVIRVLQLSPKWIPAKVAGRSVRSFRKQPVTFMVTG
ncbi:energy transducer TonB [Ferruginibacter sp. SUN002]|uniref:energy transducer TonB n=1 Tax=Ferruginibacter sp. SUN002 TaxID=2937789 RepID=UPI003D36F00F